MLKNKKYLYLLLARIGFSSNNLHLIRMVMEGKRIQTLTRGMSQTGQLLARWRKNENTSQSKIQVQSAFLVIVAKARAQKTKNSSFFSQVSGRSRCLSQSCTLFGGLGSPWVETFSCWLVEVVTHCLLCTSTEEEPGNCWGHFSATLFWTRKHHCNHFSSRFLITVECQHCLHAGETLISTSVSDALCFFVRVSCGFCSCYQVTTWRAAFPCLPPGLRHAPSVFW